MTRRNQAALIFAIALLLRLIVVFELRNLTLFRAPQLDSLEFLQWARPLAAGDFVWPNPPQHGPGYPFFLAAILSFSDSLVAVRIVQAILGATSCVLIGLTAARWFGRRALVITGLLLAVYAPLIWIDTSILAESLLLFLFACILYFRDRPLVVGLLIGLATITRPTALVLLFFAGRRPLAAGRGSELRRTANGKRQTAFLVAALVPIALVTIVNYRTTGSVIPVQAYGGMNLYLGNSPHGTGLASARLGGTWDALEAEPHPVRKLLGEIRDAPLSYLALLAKKALWLVQNDEIRDSHSFYFFAAGSRVLRWTPTFAVLFALATVGFLQAERRPWLLVAWLIAFALTCIVLVAGARYRMPLIPVLAIFAGAIRVPRTRREVIAVAVVAATAIGVTFVRRHSESRMFAEEWALSGLSLVHERRLTDAEVAYRNAIEADPRSALAWDGLGVVAFNRGEYETAEGSFRHAIALNPAYANAQKHLGMALEQRQR